MSNVTSVVMSFLESIGTKPLSATDYVAAVDSLDVDQRQKRALLNRDQRALGNLLGGLATMQCLICAPVEDSEPCEA